MDANPAAGAASPTEGLLVVHATDGWAVTPARGIDPIPVDLAQVCALVRCSIGTPLADDDPAHEVLAALGLPAPVTVDAGGTADGGARGSLWSTWTGSPAARAVPRHARMWPAAALVGRITAGAFLVEGLRGQQLLLDEIDLALVDAMTERDGMTAGEIVDGARSSVSPLQATDDDLQRRLGRLAAVGRVRWYPETLRPAPASADGPQSEPTTATPPVAAPPVAAPAVAAPAVAAPPETVLATLRRLRHASFPGRPTLVRTYRRFRPGGILTTPAVTTPAATPTDATPTVTTPAVTPTGSTGAEDTSLYLESPRVGPPVPGRIPVYAPFQLEYGPMLALGMLTASARQADAGRLNDTFEIRRPEDPESMLADLTSRSGPAIVLLSNYLWSRTHNFAVADRARAINPDVVFIHGGPDTPKYEADCQAYFDEHPDTVHVTVRGEGESAIVDLLAAMATGAPDLDLRLLHDVTGISYRDPVSASVVRTPDRDRITDLDALPSPYLTGEFDHLRPSVFSELVVFESNRGCPYGCTFCDWGSMTLSRIRKFDLDRVQREMQWAADRELPVWFFADANLGIMSRDVDLVEMLVALRNDLGVPSQLGFNVAKNTTKHLVGIVDRLNAAGVTSVLSLALQTTDEATLGAIRRTNISTDHYLQLGASFRRRGLPLQADIMLGLPGQTRTALHNDLQFLMEHEIQARVWITQVLTNAPMNDPEYRKEFAIDVDDRGILRSTSSYTAEDRAEMMRLRQAYVVFDRIGLLRHVLRFLQWDHGKPMADTLEEAIRVTREHPDRYPVLNWTLRYFDIYSVVPFGWRSFYADVRRFVLDELQVPPSTALDTVLAVQEHLMPEIGRRFPDTISVPHDFVAYQRDATVGLWSAGRYSPPERPLTDYGPARFSVYGDWLDRCGGGMRPHHATRSEAATDDYWYAYHLELDSPLVVSSGQVAANAAFLGIVEQVEHFAARIDGSSTDPVGDPEEGDASGAGAVPVAVGRRPRSAS